MGELRVLITIRTTLTWWKNTNEKDNQNVCTYIDGDSPEIKHVIADNKW